MFTFGARLVDSVISSVLLQKSACHSYVVLILIIRSSRFPLRLDNRY